MTILNIQCTKYLHSDWLRGRALSIHPNHYAKKVKSQCKKLKSSAKSWNHAMIGWFYFPYCFLTNQNTAATRTRLKKGETLRGYVAQVFAGYMPLPFENPYPIIVYSVAKHRLHLSHFQANVVVISRTEFSASILKQQQEPFFNRESSYIKSLLTRTFLIPEIPKMCDSILVNSTKNVTPLESAQLWKCDPIQRHTPSSLLLWSIPGGKQIVRARQPYTQSAHRTTHAIGRSELPRNFVRRHPLSANFIKIWWTFVSNSQCAFQLFSSPAPFQPAE